MSTIDTHALVRRERRARTARLVGVGTTAVAAAGVAIALLVGTPPAGDAPADSPPAARQPDPAPAGIELRSAIRVDAESSAQQLARVVDTGVRAAAPRTTWDRSLTVTVFEHGPSFGWNGTGALRSPTTRGDLTLTTVDLPKEGTEPGKQPLTVSCDGETGCVRGTTATGTPIVTITRSSGTATWLEVRIGLPSNRILALSATNADDSGEPVLTAGQMAAIAQHVADAVR